jgi:hypothetical protein
MKQAWETIVAFKLVGFRVFCYFFIPFALTIYEQFKDWNGDDWEVSHWFVLTQKFLYAVIMGLNNLIAFVDQSLSRARSELEHRKESKQVNNNSSSI